MLNQLQKRKEAGFTIIEVLIVLAIAGLIMLVVFLAVPALNRNSHNNQFKTEANNLLSAYQEASNNAGGASLSASADGAGDALTVKSAANAKNINNVSIIAKTTTAQTPALGAAVFVLGTKCTAQNSNVPDTTNTTSRNVSLIYTIEASGGTSYQCVSA
jgi:prepilin-type N-terminal cleavage/methylation domain-containing protein